MLLSPLYRWRNRSLEWFLHHLPEVTRLSSSRIDFSDSGIQELTVLTHLERKDWLESSFYLPLMPVHSFCHHLSFFFPCFFTGGWLQNLIPRPFFFFLPKFWKKNREGSPRSLSWRLTLQARFGSQGCSTIFETQILAREEILKVNFLWW